MQLPKGSGSKTAFGWRNWGHIRVLKRPSDFTFKTIKFPDIYNDLIPIIP
jgi:hypothetical protein